MRALAFVVPLVALVTASGAAAAAPLAAIATPAGASVSSPVAAPAAPARPRYTIDAAVDPAARVIEGTVEIVFENTATVPLADVALVLYANRFAGADPGVDDRTRPFVYPREEFVAGGIEVTALAAAAASFDAAASAGAPPAGGGAGDRRRSGAATGPQGVLDATRMEALGGWPRTLLRARLPAPLAPGARAALRMRFRAVLPERYGPFGVAEGRLAALGGWFPTLAALDPGGTWDATVPPSASEIAGILRAPGSATVVIGTTVHAAGHAPEVSCALTGAPQPVLLASDDYVIHERDVAATSVRFLELPSRHAFRWPAGPAHAELVLDAAERILDWAIPVLGARPAGTARSLLIAEAPLRLELTAPGGAGVAVVSDRIFRVHRLLQDFHERELAAALFRALLRADVEAREAPADAPWIVEGVAAALADRYLAALHPRHRTVYDWIALFDVFAIVDRFESAPRIPFVSAFFPEARHAGELRDGVESFVRDRPPGRTIFTKLRNAIGETAHAAAVDRYLTGGERFRDAVAAVVGRRQDGLLAEWALPYPPTLNYALAGAELNRESDAAPEAGRDGQARESSAGGSDDPPAGARSFRHRLAVTRDASRPVGEAVEIEVAGDADQRTRVVWNDDAARADLEVTTPFRARRATLDPERKLLEDTRVDNARPPRTQIVLDSADVTVTSSEFGISGLFVARRRYDYRRDLGLVAFFDDRGVGMHVGPRLHFGPPNDAATYRHNLFGFYTLAGLRGDFGDDSRPGLHTDGTLGGLGLRYDYDDELSYDNPTTATKVRFFGDWFHGAFGSSFDYLDWGARLRVVRPLVTARTLIAFELLNAFSTPTASDRVPNQGRYSLGGDLAIRGIPVDARLGENIALARLELRQTVYPQVDLDLADVLVVRYGQLRFFVDAGHVEDRRSTLYRLADFAVGVGVGAAMAYDFMGFFPSVAYVAVAQRVDRFDGVDNGVQFLFGTRQAF